MSAVRVPTSTYRLQITTDFDLFEAAERLAYLHDLGVDWVYLSPLLASEPGSTHGYDVVACDHIDPDRGGAEGLAALSAEARRLGLGVLVDIVPNHVGVATPSRNAWWWDVLQHGRESEHATAFDIEWSAGDGRLLIPVVGDGDEDAIEVREGELRYHDLRFPLAPGTSTHDEQHYRLVGWREADGHLNYRRFFAVNSLAAVRVEDPEVFAQTHVEVRRWFAEGLVDGLRVDHPDGLRDPQRYLEDLCALTGGAYVLVEGSKKTPDVILVATGSEVSVAVEAAATLESQGIGARVVSMPCVEWFVHQDAKYKEQVLPRGVRARVSIEAGSPMGWRDIVGDAGVIIGIDHFGASADGKKLLTEFGFTPEHVVAAAKESLATVKDGDAVPGGSGPSAGGVGFEKGN